MAIGWDPGPVFAFEWLANTRRWQVYALRSAFVAMLLASLVVVWYAEVAGQNLPTIQAKANVGRFFSYAIIGTQLVLVLLAAPATTAGALCLDKSRGTLTHLLVTDLTSTEIVVGKLASRLIPAFALVACALPAMALGTLLGGVDPNDLMGAFLISLGVAALGSSLALLISVWGRKTHEVLLVTYAILIVWALGGPAATLFGISTPWGRWDPQWFSQISPFWFAFGNQWQPGAVGLGDDLLFLAAAWTASAAFVTIAVVRLRPVVTRQAGELVRGSRLSRRWALARWLERWTGPLLDPNPVLWREWHRRRHTRWGRVLWASFALASIAAGATMLYSVLWGNRFQSEISMVLNGGQVAIGFLFLSVLAATSLAEERARGSLDVVLATPMSTLSIVWGKWWGTYRGTLVLCVIPALVASVVAYRHERGLGVVLEVAMILAFGAALTSLGLAIATRVPRLGRAIALTVTAYILVTVGWMFLALMLAKDTPRRNALGLASGSPFIATMWPLIEMQERWPFWAECVAWMTFWIVVYAALAAALFLWTLSTFDQCLERISDGPEALPRPKRRAGLVPIAVAKPTASVEA